MTEVRDALLEPRRRLVIGHRGAPFDAPENTLESLRLAVEQGADALEFDVHLSADGVPVLMHDADVLRTTGVRGHVWQLTLDELRALDAGATFSPDGGRTFPWRGRGVRIPTLEEVIGEFRGIPLLIELKEARAQEPVRSLLERLGCAGRCVPASALDEALESFRRAPFAYSASQREIARLYFGAMSRVGAPRRAAYRALSVPVTWRGLPVATGPLIRAADRLGCPVHVWTVDDPRLATRLWALGAAGIVTNRPAAMREALRGMESGHR